MNTEKQNNMENAFWALSEKEVFDLLNTRKDGLTNKEVEERLSLGKNVLPNEEKGAKLKIIINQFKNPLIIVLIIAGLVTLFIGEIRDSIFIFAAVFINSILGFYQESKAENALSKLQTYVKERARVVREGREQEIDASEIVLGDIIKLTIGARVPADARVINAKNLSIDEAILTGESLPAKKSNEKVNLETVIADQNSMVFSGTLVGSGVGEAIVVRTGINTEIGRIAKLVKGGKDEKTPLQDAIQKFSVKISIGLSILTIALFGFGIASGIGLYEMFIVSVAIAVAAVPEGLPIALTVILAVGVERLAKQKGIVRRLLAAETLGSTTLILTDKTGTLTEARMELAEIKTEISHEKVLEKAILAAESVVENPESSPDEWRIIGSPLEAAIIQAGAKYSVFFQEIKDSNEILEMQPFSSIDKFSSVRVKNGPREDTIYLGAPDVLIEMAGLHKKERDSLLVHVDELAHSGYRLLGVLENKTFLGLLAFNDPVREGLSDVIKDVSSAGIKTVIATGDHKGTALAVANKLDMNVTHSQVLTGPDLRELEDKELSRRLYGIRIFARVSPADKLRLVNLYKQKGEVVAVTGDGVNDAPALKGADIGIAVGSGTDVAKGASDLIILDDNFSTIVAAISEGRRVLQNMRKVIVYLFSNALDEIMLIGGAIMFGIPLPINALQILWVNFFTDSFPAVALAFEKEKHTLKGKPSKLNTLIDREMKFLTIIIGTLSSISLFALYYLLLKLGFDVEIVRTFIFANFSVYTLFLAFSLKSLKQSIFKYNPFSNKYLIGGTSIGILLTIIAIYVPAVQDLLGTVSLSPIWMAAVLFVGALNIFAVEFGKYIYRNKE